jgi:hypothetical protein
VDVLQEVSRALGRGLNYYWLTMNWPLSQCWIRFHPRLSTPGLMHSLKMLIGPGKRLLSHDQTNSLLETVVAPME